MHNLSLIHISELTRQAETSYAVFCLKKKTKDPTVYRVHAGGTILPLAADWLDSTVGLLEAFVEHDL